MFSFYPCDVSFNGTTPTRGQIPCLLYYSSRLKPDSINGKIRTEIHARDTALKVNQIKSNQIKPFMVLFSNYLLCFIFQIVF